MRRYINREGLYAQNNSTPRFSLHSTDSSLPTFSIMSGDITELMSIGQELMIENNYDKLCLIEQDTLAFYYLRKAGGEFSIKIETGFDLEGPLYGLNLNCSY